MDTPTNNKKKKETCGIIMPISANDGYSADHWTDVKILLEEVVNDAGFIPKLVSDADEVGIIHNRIVSNIYNNPIVICDVSSKNPNVMFELGLRLAFDKATIIIKDDSTNYNFDTAPIEHLTYPRDLRYSIINKFKLKLKEKLVSTYQASLKPEYSTFLKNFVQYKPKLEETEIPFQEYIFKQFDNLNKQLAEIKRMRPENKSGPLNNEIVIRNDFIDFYLTTELELIKMSREEIAKAFYAYQMDIGRNNFGLTFSEFYRILDPLIDNFVGDIKNQ